MEFINIPFAYIMRWFDSFTHSYALSLLLFAILIKVIFIPVGIKQQKNQIKMASLRPKEAVIKKKYAGRTDRATQQKMQQELMELQQKENASPLGGCLPLLIQMVFIVILYQIIRNPLTYICQMSKEAIVDLAGQIGYTVGGTTVTLDNIGKIDQISMIAQIPQSIRDTLPALANLPNFDFLGLDLSMTPMLVWNGFLGKETMSIFGDSVPTILNVILYAVIPVVCFLSQVLTMKLTRKFTYQSQAMQPDGANGCSTQMMDWSMPLLSLFFCYTFPLAIGMYWIYQNILSFAQTVILAKAMPIPVLTDEDYKRAEKEMKAKGYDTKRVELPRVRSLHHIDDDDYDELPDAPKDGAKGSSQPLLNGEKVPLKDESDKKAPKLKDESDKK